MSLLCESRELYFCFCSTSSHLFSFACKPGFDHVFIVERFDTHYLLVNSTRSGMMMTLVDCTDDDYMYRLMTETEMTVVKVVSNDRKKGGYRLRLISCVTIAMHYSNLDFGLFCLTPYSLYTRLMSGKHQSIDSVETLRR